MLSQDLIASKVARLKRIYADRGANDPLGAAAARALTLRADRAEFLAAAQRVLDSADDPAREPAS